MKRYRGLMAALAVAVVIVLCLRLFFVTLLVIPQNGERPVFHAGDRVWVSRLSYGMRLPLMRWLGYVRLSPKPVPVGHWVVFNNPAETDEPVVEARDVFVGYCFAAPGDTLWLNAEGRASRFRNRRNGCVWPLVVPARGQMVKIEPWNAHIYARTINAHEPWKAAVIDHKLCVDGRMVSAYCFQADYYWMTTGNAFNRHDSRQFGFVPSSHIVGRMRWVLYSLDASRPWYKRLCPDRLFLEVATGCSHCQSRK